MFGRFIFLLVLVTFFDLSAQEIKVAMLPPEGTTWADLAKEMGKEIQEKTNNKVIFKFYFGGVAGDESDVLRKMRIGQLHSGFFTGRTLGELFGDIRIMEIPFSFYHDREKAFKLLQKNTEYFNKGLEKKGIKNLGFYEIGQAYLISKKYVKNLDEIKKLKIWSWEGDLVVKSLMEALQLTYVPLAITDVLSSLSTGIIDSAYTTPVALLALQWNTKIKYVVDYPVSYAIAALLVDLKTWKKISQEHQAIILEIAKKYIDLSNEKTVIENQQAIDVIKQMGITFLEMPKEDLDKSTTVHNEIINKLKGSLISDEIVKKFKSL